MSAICIIPARGGSVRIPRKNIKLFHGKPIIEYSIENAKESGLFEEIVVSTDDGDIAAIAHANGVDVHQRLYDDGTAGTQEVTRQVLLDRDDVPILACCLYPTAPLLNIHDLVYAVVLVQSIHSFAFSVGTDPLRDAGQFYCGRTSAFLEQAPLIAPHTAMVSVSENRVCDINTMDDWKRAEKMYEALHA